MCAAGARVHRKGRTGSGPRKFYHGHSNASSARCICCAVACGVNDRCSLYLNQKATCNGAIARSGLHAKGLKGPCVVQAAWLLATPSRLVDTFTSLVSFHQPFSGANLQRLRSNEAPACIRCMLTVSTKSTLLAAIRMLLVSCTQHSTTKSQSSRFCSSSPQSGKVLLLISIINFSAAQQRNADLNITLFEQQQQAEQADRHLMCRSLCPFECQSHMQASRTHVHVSHSAATEAVHHQKHPVFYCSSCDGCEVDSRRQGWLCETKLSQLNCSNAPVQCFRGMLTGLLKSLEILLPEAVPGQVSRRHANNRLSLISSSHAPGHCPPAVLLVISCYDLHRRT